MIYNIKFKIKLYIVYSYLEFGNVLVNNPYHLNIFHLVHYKKQILHSYTYIHKYRQKINWHLLYNFIANICWDIDLILQESKALNEQSA